MNKTVLKLSYLIIVLLTFIFKANNHQDNALNETIETVENLIEIEPPTTYNKPCPDNRRRQRHSVIGTRISQLANKVNQRPELRSIHSAIDTRTPRYTSRINNPQSTKLKIRTDKSAKVLFSVVILFLATHCYRIALKIYESSFPNTSTINSFKICFNLRRYVS